MATLKTTSVSNWNTNATAGINTSIMGKYVEFLDGQKANRTLWFMISLAVQACVTLPLPLVLIGYFNAPIAFLAITMLCFFTTFVANMGGSGIRTTLTCFLASMAIHIGMVLWVWLS